MRSVIHGGESRRRSSVFRQHRLFPQRIPVIFDDTDYPCDMRTRAIASQIIKLSGDHESVAKGVESALRRARSAALPLLPPGRERDSERRRLQQITRSRVDFHRDHPWRPGWCLCGLAASRHKEGLEGLRKDRDALRDAAMELRQAQTLLADLSARVRHCQDQLAAEAVRRGASYADAGRMLGIERQAAHKRIVPIIGVTRAPKDAQSRRSDQGDPSPSGH